jgi:hypothetical protein
MIMGWCLSSQRDTTDLRGGLAAPGIRQTCERYMLRTLTWPPLERHRVEIAPRSADYSDLRPPTTERHARLLSAMDAQVAAMDCKSPATRNQHCSRRVRVYDYAF